MNRLTICFALILCITLTACGNSVNNPVITEDTFSETAVTTSIFTEPETIASSEAETTATITTAETTSFTYDETDEILVQGYEFAEKYADMSWKYYCGAAWFDYVNIKYFDFGNKSEGNYLEIEEDGRKIPFYKLLITDYTYDELIEYIKSFYTEDLYDVMYEQIILFTNKDNCIYVNGNEPTCTYPPRNEKAYIVDYIVNDDGTVTYNCHADGDKEADGIDCDFSFTLDNMKLCAFSEPTYIEMLTFLERSYFDEYYKN